MSTNDILPIKKDLHTLLEYQLYPFKHASLFSIILIPYKYIFESLVYIFIPNIFLFINTHDLSLSCHDITVKVFIVGRDFVD